MPTRYKAIIPLAIAVTLIAACAGEQPTPTTAPPTTTPPSPTATPEEERPERVEISPQGGSFELGGIEFIAPPGSLPAPSTLTVSTLPDDVAGGMLPPGLELLSPLYELNLETDLPIGEVGVAIPYDDADVDPDQGRVYIALYSDGEWKAMPSVVDREAGVIRAATTHLSIAGVARDVFGQRPQIVNVRPDPIPYTFTADDSSLTRDITVNVLVKDPDARVDKAQVVARFRTTTGEFIAEQLKENAVWTYLIETKPAHGLVAELDEGPANEEGLLVYSVVLPVSDEDFFGMAGVHEILFDVTLQTDGIDPEASYTLPISRRGINLALETPANGAVVGLEPRFEWDGMVTVSAEYEVELRICNNGELHHGLILGGCNPIVEVGSTTQALDGEDKPALKDGEYWWGLAVKEPVYFGDAIAWWQEIYRTDSHYFVVKEDPLADDEYQDAARLEVTPPEVEPGLTFAVAGYYFEGQETVVLSGVPTEAEGDSVAVSTGETGFFRQSFAVPEDAEPGPRELKAVGSESGITVEATWTVLEPSHEEEPGDEKEADETEEEPEQGGGLPRPETEEGSNCLAFGDLPPLDIILSKHSDEVVTVELPVLDRCGERPPSTWIGYPWVKGIQDMSIDAGRGTLVVDFSSGAAPVGHYEGQVGVRYPGEPDPIMAAVSVDVTDQAFALPRDYFKDWQGEWGWVEDEVTKGSCVRESHREVVEVVSGRYARLAATLEEECQGELQPESASWEEWYDLFTGEQLLSTCDDCVFPATWERTGTRTMEVLGKTLDVYVTERQTREPDNPGWVWVYDDRFFIDEATNLTVAEEWSGKSYYNGEYSGNRAYGTGKVTNTNAPLGGKTRGESTDPLPTMEDWLADRCAASPPSQALSVLVNLTDAPDLSFTLHLGPSGNCTVSPDPVDEPDVTMTVDSGGLVDLLNGDVWYSTLVGEGRLAIKGTSRDRRNAFLEFLLDF